ncbi:MAG TPA: hypothetical protein VM715_12710, partial [Candidatus Acidoferrum sp.]|nr:hypothetical protein [Candidatus Acidoferrum sp.]
VQRSTLATKMFANSELARPHVVAPEQELRYFEERINRSGTMPLAVFFLLAGHSALRLQTVRP